MGTNGLPAGVRESNYTPSRGERYNLKASNDFIGIRRESGGIFNYKVPLRTLPVITPMMLSLINPAFLLVAEGAVLTQVAEDGMDSMDMIVKEESIGAGLDARIRANQKKHKANGYWDKH